MPTKVDPIVTDLKLLKKKSRQTTWAEVEKLNIIERIKAANETAWTKGAGLAAIQIGERLRVCWLRSIELGKEWTLVNPVIISQKEPVIVTKEGCLSIPGVWSQTMRCHVIQVRHLGKEGPEVTDFKGFPAIVIQHEVDHMDGILNLERRYFPPYKGPRNEPCPMCLKKGVTIKYKKCKEHFEKITEAEVIK